MFGNRLGVDHSIGLATREQVKFIFYIFPHLVIGQGALGRGYSPPAWIAGKISVQLHEMGLIRCDLGCFDNCPHRAFPDADRAVYAFIGVDDEKVRPLVETVHGAYGDTIRVLACNTAFGNNKWHDNDKARGAVELYSICHKNV